MSLGRNWKCGLSIDSLVAAELVTADGQTVRVSERERPDLLWALRGGGGNFGVVTSFEYRLHAIGPQVQLGLFFWGVEQGAEALRFCRDFVPRVPQDMGAFIAGLSAPPAPFVPEPYRFAPGYAFIVVGFGSAVEHGRIAQQVRAGMPPLFELVTPIPYTYLQQMFDEAAAWGAHAYEKALYLDDLSDGAIDVFEAYLPRKQSPLSFVLGGAYGRVSEEATAFGGSRGGRRVESLVSADGSLRRRRHRRAPRRRVGDNACPEHRFAGQRPDRDLARLQHRGGEVARRRDAVKAAVSPSSETADRRRGGGSMERADVGGIGLEYEVAGSGEPVVFIHGALIADTFRPLVGEPCLAGRYRLITYHRRGYVGSSRGRGPVGFGQHAADCRALLRHLGVERAHVVGHSYGGNTALQLALDAPEVVHSLALLEPGLMVGATAESYRAAQLRVVQRYREAGAEVAVDVFMRARWPGHRPALDRLLPGSFAQAVADAEAAFEQDIGGLDWRFGEAEARRIAQPTLAALGGESEARWPRFGETQRLLLAWLPRADGFVLPGATHFMQVQNPHDLAVALDAFLARHPLGAPAEPQRAQSR